MCCLTIRKCQNTDDKEEGDDQNEPHPKIVVRVSIISAHRVTQIKIPVTRQLISTVTYIKS